MEVNDIQMRFRFYTKENPCFENHAPAKNLSLLIYLTFPMTEKYNNLRNLRVRLCPSENIGVFFRSIKSLQTKIYDSKKIFRPFRKTARWSLWIHCIKFCNFPQFSFPQLVQMVFTESSADSRVVVHTGRPVTE